MIPHGTSLLDDTGYPTEEALQRLSDWPLDDPLGWFEFAKSLWWHADWGWHQSQRNDGTTYFKISTAGWSGNEAILDAMGDSPLWSLTWESSQRGGHHTFTVPPPSRRGAQEAQEEPKRTNP